MSDERIERMFREGIARGWSRRQLLQAGVAAGLVLPLSTALARSAAGAPLAQGTENPLGVDPAAPLDVVIFKGGFGDDYAKNVNDNLYKKLYPDAQITYAGIQRLGEQLQPRFVSGNPPDVIDNSGAGNLDNAALAAEGQLADLGDLMAAPSYDTEGKTFGETLAPGSQETGIFDGKQLLLNWALTVTGVWYSQTFMESKGYTYPKTWDEMMGLSKELKGSGVAPWVTTGVHPQYIRGFVFDQMLWKHDPQAIVNIDNLEADAWKAPAVAEVLEALVMLGEQEFFLSGWEGLDHIQSQNEWLQGKGVFLPCGTWLENEMKDSIPADFNMVVAPTPSLPGDKIAFEGIFAGGGEPFIVPSEGKNVAGGKEWLRLLFSKEGGRFFAESTKSLSVVQGSGEGLDLGTAFGSTQAALTAAGTNTFTARYGDWYKDLGDTAKSEIASLLQGQSSIEEFQAAVQEASDATKDDPAITKYQR
ncbi:MAG: ABC transporter, substrate-binding protein (cluster 1, maltose/g3p/polyamine/iron) [uncultured Thermomicrobiales bacterium]|uniref:sn-glycerol-3-phosphate-binding periplasmic protein UgpB n=1 Tax=uncultured Thermomicrobiales bacterium TaxID=1645740 RepID=A0A6J4ULG0_9BACT|nr:MAG: ABC transporter, substrate-binding protein (cluster 1, maltose/g3p/polyamine/iron) [uncultured Thermomicrobiales bacterium]